MKLKSFFNTILTLIFLSILGFAFYLGLEQIELDENTYGIVFTKTTGWKDQLLEKKGFKWSIEKVIPTNYKIHKFKIEKIPISINTTETLPSGDLYADFAQIDKSNFKYNYSVNSFVKFKKEYLINYTQKGYFTEETFNNWIENKTNIIKESIISYINHKIELGETLTINSNVSNYITSTFPDFSFDEIIINLKQSDFVLYNTVRSRYINYIETQKEAEKKYLKRSLEDQNELKLKLELIELYGEVFTKYPIMIEYIKADKGLALDRARLEDFIVNQNRN